MNAENIKIAIRKALAATAGDNAFHETSAALLRAMKYRSERVLAGQTGDPGDFVQAFPAANPATKSEQEFLDSAKSVRVLFQYTDEEVRSDAQPALFEDRTFYRNNDRAFIFSAVDLECDSYPRGRYAAFTREINKRIDAPTIVLFRTPSNLVTLAFVHRRPNKRDASRDVLGSVSLIREIDADDPHRAHLDILAELSLSERLDWMDERAKPRNFDGLLDAWLYALDTEELNKSFYRDLFQWFERAVSVAKFPKDRRMKPEQHVIRLITRLLFVWFIKEKRLIADDLFIENRVKRLLKDYDRETGDSYYRAVLQNLFFATLNTEIGQRGFSRQTRTTYRNFSKYRFRNQIADEAALMDLFGQTPFINGGLFDCLDTETAPSEGGYRIDCFSDVDYPKLSIPNRLFFGDDGLITLFEKYKFTVEENTPVEREVALDPELLGKVFENLLAAYNPETRDNARKQTGSYYTPRAVVDYMVDEALVASLAQNAKTEDSDSWERRLRYLMDYDDAFDDADELFTQQEREAIVRAISETKILDPAVGSGAFPMGTLHKLTLALRRLDSDNKIWERLQRQLASSRAERAFGTNDQAERDEELKEISETFEKYRDSDYGRKLYLIQNSIYGVDIQPVATQIAKLRFFISLAIEQQTDPAADNYGIKPLPNLETRFVAANTLLSLGGLNRELTSDRTRKLQRSLNVNRERHFHAATRRAKLKYRDEDSELRTQLAQSLTDSGLDADHAARVAAWDPYDQNASADWFDTGYMFGVSEGFDVVIGNPPYVQLQKNRGRLRRLYHKAGFKTLAARGDIYQLFYERGCRLMKPNSGLIAYITSNSWMKAEYGKSTRSYFSENHSPLRLLDLGKDVFESVIVDSAILLLREGGGAKQFPAIDMDNVPNGSLPPEEDSWEHIRPNGEMPWSVMSDLEQSVMDKMLAVGTPLKEWDIDINYGVKTGYNKAFIIDNRTKEALVAEDTKSAEILKPVVRGRDIQRYRVIWADKWLVYSRRGININNYPSVYKFLMSHYDGLSKKSGSNKWYELQANPSDRLDAQFLKEKLFWIELVNNSRFAYDDSSIYGEATTFLMTGESLKYLCAVLNSQLITLVSGNNSSNFWYGNFEMARSVTLNCMPIPSIIHATSQNSAFVV